jgi:hypothetical protein
LLQGEKQLQFYIWENFIAFCKTIFSTPYCFFRYSLLNYFI